MNDLYLMHHGVQGMKWGVRRYQNEDGSYKSGAKGRYNDGEVKIHKKADRNRVMTSTNKNAAKKSDAYKIKRKERAKTIAKVGAVTAGTALAAYGTYKLAKYASEKRNSAAFKKAESYVKQNFMEKVGQSSFANGKNISYFRNGAGFEMEIGSRGSKDIGKMNAATVKKARQMYSEATNTKLDKGLRAVVKAGDSVGNVTRNTVSKTKESALKAKEAASVSINNTKNKALDVVKPQYAYVEGKGSSITKDMGNGIKMTTTTTPLNRVKVARAQIKRR